MASFQQAFDSDDDFDYYTTQGNQHRDTSLDGTPINKLPKKRSQPIVNHYSHCHQIADHIHSCRHCQQLYGYRLHHSENRYPKSSTHWHIPKDTVIIALIIIIGLLIYDLLFRQRNKYY